MMRLAKFLALAGIASRRKAEELILSGKIKFNGQTHKLLSQTIDEQYDQITYGQRLLEIEKKVYYLLHKPEGYISAAAGKRGEKLVTDLVPSKPKVYPVGRLDKDSSGLILLTNDGDLAYTLMHPKFEIAKTYLVKTTKPITARAAQQFKNGVRLKEGMVKVDSVKKINNFSMEITIHQGWNRQIRRMIGHLDNEVIILQRIQEGSLSLGTLKSGEYKLIKPPVFHE